MAPNAPASVPAGETVARIPLDVHAHLVPVDHAALARIADVEWQAEDGALWVDGHLLRVADLYHPERLLGWMDRNGVQRALISAPPPLYRQHLKATQALEWARYLNDGLLEIAARHGERLGALLHLPLEHPTVAQLLEAAYEGSGCAGFALAAGGTSRIDFADARHADLWQALDRRGAFVFIHPGHCCDDRLARFYLENLLGNPYETTVAATQLVMADIPRRYPGIRFCLAHGGGLFAAVCGRLQRGYDTGRPGVPRDIEPPLQAARRFYVDGITHLPAGLRLAAEVFGESHVLFGSDWPFPMGMPEPAIEGGRTA